MLSGQGGMNTVAMIRMNSLKETFVKLVIEPDTERFQGLVCYRTGY